METLNTLYNISRPNEYALRPYLRDETTEDYPLLIEKYYK